MSNELAMSDLRGFEEAVRHAPEALDELAREVLPELRATIAANISAQRAPDGSSWPPGIDGHPVLIDALKSITVESRGPEIVFTVRGVESRHHLGIIRGAVARPLIPTDITPQLAASLERSIDRVLARRLGGA